MNQACGRNVSSSEVNRRDVTLQSIAGQQCLIQKHSFIEHAIRIPLTALSLAMQAVRVVIPSEFDSLDTNRPDTRLKSRDHCIHENQVCIKLLDSVSVHLNFTTLPLKATSLIKIN